MILFKGKEYMSHCTNYFCPLRKDCKRAIRIQYENKEGVFSFSASFGFKQHVDKKGKLISTTCLFKIDNKEEKND